MRARDAIGDLEADSEHTRELVGVLHDHAARRVGVLVADPLGQVGEPVGREQQVKLTQRAQFVPGAGGLLGAERVQADATEGRSGLRIDLV